MVFKTSQKPNNDIPFIFWSVLFRFSIAIVIQLGNNLFGGLLFVAILQQLNSTNKNISSDQRMAIYV